MKVKEAKSQTSLLTSDVIVLLRPLQKAVKACGNLILNSPWSYLSVPQNGYSTYGLKSPAPQVPLPMTPQSAALGPAVQATVPSTPQSASYNAMFSGNVFERADALLSMNSSAASSRSGTMTSNDGISSSMTSPATSMVSNNSMNSRFNFNGNGGKMAF